MAGNYLFPFKRIKTNVFMTGFCVKL